MRGAAALRWPATSLALVLALSGCAPLGVGLTANNRGAAIGLSTGVSLPTMNAARDSRVALPPPTLDDAPAAAGDKRP